MEDSADRWSCELSAAFVSFRNVLAIVLLAHSGWCLAGAIGQHSQPPYPASTEHAAPAWYIDVAAKAGITMRNVNGSITSKHYIIESTGSGVAIIDYDRDGWPDIFLVNGSTLPGTKPSEPPTNHLFHNNHDGTFTDVTAKAGLVSTGWGQGACVGDYDNDGFDDIYVTGYGANRLFHNQGNGTFREVAQQSGVAGSGKEWGTGCAFIDYDRDGKLDLVVANYVHFDITKTPAPGQGLGCVLRLHFGLGASPGLTSIEIRWPNGRNEIFDPPLSLDHFIDVTEGTGVSKLSPIGLALRQAGYFRLAICIFRKKTSAPSH